MPNVTKSKNFLACMFCLFLTIVLVFCYEVEPSALSVTVPHRTVPDRSAPNRTNGTYSVPSRPINCTWTEPGRYLQSTATVPNRTFVNFLLAPTVCT